VAARRRRRRLNALEAGVGVVMIVLLGAAFYQRPPPPLSPGRQWLLAAGPAMNGLAAAIARATADPASVAAANALDAATAGALRVGPPPGPTQARLWAQVIDEATRAEATPDLVLRTQLLNEAGLALVAVDVASRST
jgi:hypothetical protein